MTGYEAYLTLCESAGMLDEVLTADELQSVSSKIGNISDNDKYHKLRRLFDSKHNDYWNGDSKVSYFPTNSKIDSVNSKLSSGSPAARKAVSELKRHAGNSKTYNANGTDRYLTGSYARVADSAIRHYEKLAKAK